MEEHEAEPLLETLKRAAAALSDAGVRFAVAGSAAAYARGAGPPQKDVDFVLVEHDVERSLQALSAVGMQRVDPPEDWLVKAYDDDRQIDLIFCPAGRPVTPELLHRAEPLGIAGLTVPVLGGTDLMVMKLLSLCEHACDFTDPLTTARGIREQVDWHTVREETKSSPFAHAFLVLLERLHIIDPPLAAGSEQP